LSGLPRPRAAPRHLLIKPLLDFSIFDQHEHPYIGPISTERRHNILQGHQHLCERYPRHARAFVATLDGRPVGYSLVLLDRGVAGIYWVGVIRRFRRRGIGAAITLAAMRFAQQHGYRYAVLQASGEGESVYRRLGFEEVCRLSLWYYSRRHHDR
jgi:ribosomal protein S18 acetylase RimI-like enzyme